MSTPQSLHFYISSGRCVCCSVLFPEDKITVQNVLFQTP